MFRDTVLRKDKKEIMIIKTLQKEKKKKTKLFSFSMLSHINPQ